MAEGVKSVLFLCTGNSARSLLAECLLERLGRELGYDTARLRSKSWDEFARPGAPPLDLVVTVCDAAAGEACPYFSGTPERLHWSIDDPAGVHGSEAEVSAAFRRAYDELERRVAVLVKESR